MKSERDLVGQRYAQALVDLVTGEAAVPSSADKVASDLDTINTAISKSADLNLALDHPAYSVAQKKSLLQHIFMGAVQEITLSLLDLLVIRRRLDLLPAIERQYNILLNEKRDVVTAQLVSSEKLSDTSVADIKARLNEYLGKTLHLDASVDPALIAGYVLRIKDQVIDGSLKGKLAGIEKTLLNV